MIIKFKRIGCKNFHAFDDLTFEIQEGKHLVTGKNGSGKSSIFEIMPYNLFKSSTRGKNPSKNYKGDCLTWVEFEKGDSLYRVERYLNDSKENNNLKIFENGEPLTKRLKGMVEDDLQSLLNITEDLFTSSVVVLQGLPTNFSAMTPTVRKTMVEEMLKFTLWDVVKERSSTKLKLEQNVKFSLENDFNIKKNEMVALNSKIDTIKSIVDSNKDQLKASLKLAKQVIAEETEKSNIIKDNISKKLSELNYSSITDLLSDIKQYDNKLFEIKNKIRVCTNLINKRVCSECNQPYPEDKIAEAQKDLDNSNLRMTKVNSEIQRLSEYRTMLEEMNNELCGIDSGIKMASNDAQRIARELSSNSNIEDTTPYETKLNELLESVNIIKTNIDESTKLVDNLKYIDGLMLPSSKFRTSVLRRYISSINNILDTVSPLILDGFSASLEIDSRETGIEINIQRNGMKFEYKSMSGGQRRRLDILIILATQKFRMESSGVSTNLVVFDEIFDSLDEESVNVVLNAIMELFDSSTSVYVITHNPHVKVNFNSVVKARLDGDSSVVEQQTSNS